jgi:hypothetical protein
VVLVLAPVLLVLMLMLSSGRIRLLLCHSMVDGGNQGFFG